MAALFVIGCSNPAAPVPAPTPPEGPNAAETPHYTTQALPIPAGSEPYRAVKRGCGAEARAIWDELTQCLGARTCGKTDEGKVREKASAAFACFPDSTLDVALRADAEQEAVAGQIVVTLPESPRRFGFSRTTSISRAVEGEASFILRVGTGTVFEVAGCGSWAVLLCVNANRSVRTDTATYENTADRLCFWGRELEATR